LCWFCARGNCAELRVVSLLPSNTETLYALGIAPVCVSDFCDAPAAVARCGDSYTPGIEKILSLKPDVVLLGASKTSGAQERLARLGVKTAVVAEPRTVEGVIESVGVIGAAVGAQKKADVLAAKLRAELKNTETNMRKGPAPRVYIEIDANHWTAGGGSYISDIVARAGGVNVFSELKADYVKVSWESVAAKKPDVILDLSFARTEFEQLAGKSLVPAIKNSRVLRLTDKDKYLRPSVRIAEAVRELNALLFPAEGAK